MRNFSFMLANFDADFLDSLHWLHSERAQFVDEDFDPIPADWMWSTDLDAIVGERTLDQISDTATAIDAHYGDYELQVVVYIVMKYRHLNSADLYDAVVAELS